LGRALLRRTGALCLLVNERNERARSLYLRAGFASHGHYRTIFLHPVN
jgi:predicted GNAT family acetyltransferase